MKKKGGRDHGMKTKKGRLTRGQSGKPRKVKISFLSLTRIDGKRKLVTMND